MKCREFDEHDAIFGEGERKAALLEHALGCPGCRAHLDEYRKFLGLMKNASDRSRRVKDAAELLECALGVLPAEKEAEMNRRLAASPGDRRCVEDIRGKLDAILEDRDKNVVPFARTAGEDDSDLETQKQFDSSSDVIDRLKKNPDAKAATTARKNADGRAGREPAKKGE